MDAAFKDLPAVSKASHRAPQQHSFSPSEVEAVVEATTTVSFASGLVSNNAEGVYLLDDYRPDTRGLWGKMAKL